MALLCNSTAAVASNGPALCVCGGGRRLTVHVNASCRCFLLRTGAADSSVCHAKSCCALGQRQVCCATVSLPNRLPSCTCHDATASDRCLRESGMSACFVCKRRFQATAFYSQPHALLFMLFILPMHSMIVVYNVIHFVFPAHCRRIPVAEGLSELMRTAERVLPQQKR